MIVSVNSMNSEKISRYLLWDRQEKRCALCVSNTFSQNKRHDLNRHSKIQHQTEIEGNLMLVLGSELRNEYVNKKREVIRRRQNLLTKRSC